MNGRAAIDSHRKRIEAVFDRSKKLMDDQELLADQARYLCVLVAGFIEKAMSEVVLEYTRRHGARSLQRYVEKGTSRFTSANSAKVLALLGSFEPSWSDQIGNILVDEYKDAFDSVVTNRHQIAHGISVGLTYARMRDYFRAIVHVIDKIEDLCIPPSVPP
jgi:hypothetical protein